MEILYDNKQFIGAIDFYDKSKEFGFIAMNPAVLHGSSFYINESSFAEQFKSYDHVVVVFQVATQKSGKTKAINVRRITIENVQLALEYYPNHAEIYFKNGGRINIFKNVGIPSEIMLGHVASIIENDENRSPQTTLQHVSTLIESYPTNLDYQKARTFGDTSVKLAFLMANYGYFFDFDFDKGNGEPWIKFFSGLTTQECIEILDKYWTACKLIKNEDALLQWFEKKFKENPDLNTLERFNDLIPFLPESIQLFVRNGIDGVIMPQVQEVLKKFSESFIYPESHVDSELSRFKKIAQRTFEEEKRECISLRRINQFRSRQKTFIAYPSKTDSLDTFIKAYQQLDDEDGRFLNELRDTIKQTLNNCIRDNADSVVIICKRLQQEEALSDLLREESFYPFVISHLGKEASEMGSNEYMENKFFESYSVLSSFLEGGKREELKHEVVLMLQKSNLVNPFVLSIEKGFDLLTEEEALANITKIVKDWTIDDVKQFVAYPVSLENSPRFSEIIYSKIFQCIEVRKIANDGGDLEPLHQYCRFLSQIRDLALHDGQSKRWDEFVKTRNSDEIWLMYRYDVLKSASKEVAKSIIDAIDLGCICERSKNWYNPPALVDDTIIKECIEKSYDLFSMAAERLQTMDLDNNSNIPLAVFFTELLAKDKPDKFNSDYYELKDWETTFNRKLIELKTSNANNKRLSTILWAVHHRTPTSIDTLSEMFALLPPYLQIRCVKKLFSLIELKKISHTAKSLYEVLNKGEGKMCLPLEIVFAYLKLRESNPAATLTNETMLQLLDGRDDHREWIGIRNMVTECYGRYFVKYKDERATSRYYADLFNGQMKHSKDGIVVYAPKNMIDEAGDETKYNNKHYQSIQELTRITFEKDDYSVFDNNGKGLVYVFKKEKEMELYALARAYNFNFGRVNGVVFDRNGEEERDFCECRLSDSLDNYYNMPFNWCGNKPCFRAPLRFHVVSEWEYYTILDFLRILHIPTDYVNASGKRTKYGYYIILSSYLISFAKFYDHLKCHGCGQLMRPEGVSNFAFRAVTQFSCVDENCKEYGNTVYLNHCFNTTKCNATIDSRDSKKCPNGQYICPDCGACCSTENFKRRIDNLRMTGGEISSHLMDFVNNNKGHWERDEYYCYKCGGRAVVEDGRLQCTVCGYSKGIIYKTIRPKLENY